MMGDGEYFAEIQLSKDDFNKLYDKVIESKQWKSLPIAEKIELTQLYGGNFNATSYDTPEISKKIPKYIKNGVYYYDDVFAELYPKKSNLGADNYRSGNYIVSVLDRDMNLLYIYRYDS